MASKKQWALCALALVRGNLLLMALTQRPPKLNIDTNRPPMRPPSLVLVQRDHPGALPLHLTVSMPQPKKSILNLTGRPPARAHLNSYNVITRALCPFT